MSPIIAYHVVWGAYGFWLPNDPRGSRSKSVWSPALEPFGPPTPAKTRRSLAGAAHDRGLRLAAKGALQRPAVRFDDRQIAAVANGIGRIISDFGLPCFAAAILHSHVHMVIRRQNHLAEEWVGYFKRSASRVLRQTGLHPFADAVGNDARLPSPWADGGWKVFLHTHEDVQRAIRYVEDNPVRDGMPPQRWKWVVAYEPSRGRDG